MIKFGSIFLPKRGGKSTKIWKFECQGGVQKACRFWVDFFIVLDASWAPAWRPGGAQDASRTRLGRARRSPGGVQERRKLGFGCQDGLESDLGPILGGFLVDFGLDFGCIFDRFGIDFLLFVRCIFEGTWTQYYRKNFRKSEIRKG